MARYSQNLLGVDVLMLEYSMADPLCSEPIIHVVPPAPAPNYLMFNTLQKKPPEQAVQYQLPMAAFRQYLCLHVDPRYHEDWRLARRRAYARQYSHYRRKAVKIIAYDL